MNNNWKNDKTINSTECRLRSWLAYRTVENWRPKSYWLKDDDDDDDDDDLLGC